LILKLHPLAENDLKVALHYYFEISSKLEKKFLAQIEKQFNIILNNPNLYQYETKTSQKVVMKKFPYIIVYEQYEDIIMVLALFHTRQNPKKLMQRHGSTKT
jgi:plasmid stabilization system protein ParE